MLRGISDLRGIIKPLRCDVSRRSALQPGIVEMIKQKSKLNISIFLITNFWFLYYYVVGVNKDTLLVEYFTTNYLSGAKSTTYQLIYNF